MIIIIITKNKTKTKKKQMNERLKDDSERILANGVGKRRKKVKKNLKTFTNLKNWKTLGVQREEKERRK